MLEVRCPGCGATARFDGQAPDRLATTFAALAFQQEHQPHVDSWRQDDARKG